MLSVLDLVVLAGCYFHDSRMVLQDNMQKGEYIHQLLLKEPLTRHDTVPWHNLIGQMHT